MSKGKIIIVDDELAICTSLANLLKDAGYETNFKLSAKDALAELKVSGYDAVIADVNMPEVDGITLLKQIKELDPAMPVIIITGYPSDKTISEAMKGHAYEYITKPFNSEKIKFVVDRAVSYGRMINKNKKEEKG